VRRIRSCRCRRPARSAIGCGAKAWWAIALAAALPGLHNTVATVTEGAGGGALFFADPDKLGAEYAIAVRRARKRRGLGCLLMTRLIDIARRHGVRELVGEVLLENEPMPQMCRELGFVVASEPADPSLTMVSKKRAESRL
jgi:GNAT superfamily N-acetyltransferase